MKKALFTLSLISLFLIPLSASSQSFRYMDESGNIHFVDNVTQIPPRYRNQVLYPTPVMTGKPKKIRLTPTPKPTRTPKPTKTPKSKKTKKPQSGSFFPGSYPGSPGQFPPTQQNNRQPNIGAPTQAPLPQQPLSPLQIAPGQFPPEASAPGAQKGPTGGSF